MRSRQAVGHGQNIKYRKRAMMLKLVDRDIVPSKQPMLTLSCQKEVQVAKNVYKDRPQRKS
jgi:hypothetical protein